MKKPDSVDNFPSNLAFFIASGFYSGLSPKAPGTCGTLVGFILAILFFNLTPLDNTILVGIALGVFILIVGIASTDYLLKNSHLKEKDPQVIVIDEIAGFFIAIAGMEDQLLLLICGFVMFRVFDITKPYPIKLIEKLPGAKGIMLDDILAGVYANLAVRGLTLFGIGQL